MNEPTTNYSTICKSLRCIEHQLMDRYCRGMDAAALSLFLLLLLLASQFLQNITRQMIKTPECTESLAMRAEIPP